MGALSSRCLKGREDSRCLLAAVFAMKEARDVGNKQEYITSGSSVESALDGIMT